MKLGEVQVQGPPASPTRAQGSEMTSALLMEEDGGEGGKRKRCCCILCCRLCYRRCCGVIIVSMYSYIESITCCDRSKLNAQKLILIADLCTTGVILKISICRISSRDAILSLLLIDLSSNTTALLG